MNAIKKVYLWAEKIWFSFPQKIRFLLVGGFNTVFAYVLLNLLNFLFLSLDLAYSETIIANVALIIQYVVSVNVSFITMRYYVFQSHGVWIQEYIRAWSVYLLLFVINAPIITLFMEFLNWDLWLSQAVFLVIETILTFVLHKYYSFRK